MARQALFPETALDGQRFNTLTSSSDDDIDDMTMNNETSTQSDPEMNELLNSLAGWGWDSSDTTALPDDSIDNEGKDQYFQSDSSSSDGGAETIRFAEELNEWRKAHVESPYETWSDERKRSMMVRIYAVCCGVSCHGSLQFDPT